MFDVVQGSSGAKAIIDSAPGVTFAEGVVQEREAVKNWVVASGEVPAKICYGGSGAEAWHSIVGSPRYDLGIREKFCLDVALQKFSKSLPAKLSAVMHLGSGDGSEIPIVVRHLPPSRWNKYFIVDISGDLLALAARNAKSVSGSQRIIKVVADIETEEVVASLGSESLEEPRLFLLAGNGVLLSSPATWRNLSRLVRTIDYVLVTLEVTDQVKPWRIAANYSLPVVRRLLANGLGQLGLSRPTGRFISYLSGSELQVIFELSPNDRQVWKGYWGSDLDRDSLVLLKSPKLPHSGVLDVVACNGFEICDAILSTESSCMGLLLQKHPDNLEA